MAHQCLQCGQTFPDGSQELLKGCPKCQGTRFFYTQSPLEKQEREALMKQANQDLRAILQEVVKGGTRPRYDDPVWSQQAREKWLQVDARKLQAHEEGAVKEVAPPARAAPRPAQAAKPAPRTTELEEVADVPWVQDAPAPPKHHATKQAELPWIEPEVTLAKPAPPPVRASPPPTPVVQEPREHKPEVVVVNEPGRYDIDVQQLMENSPVVVRRDGVYVVHLPSVFEAARKS